MTTSNGFFLACWHIFLLSFHRQSFCLPSHQTVMLPSNSFPFCLPTLTSQEIAVELAGFLLSSSFHFHTKSPNPVISQVLHVGPHCFVCSFSLSVSLSLPLSFSLSTQRGGRHLSDSTDLRICSRAISSLSVWSVYLPHFGMQTQRKSNSISSICMPDEEEKEQVT